MKTKTITTIAVVVVLALVAAGVGYAYTSTTQTASNSITTEEIMVYPGVVGTGNEFTPVYTGDTKHIDYDTVMVSGQWRHVVEQKMEGGQDQGQDLSKITNIKIDNTGSAKTLKSLQVTISESSFVDQFKEGGAYYNSLDQLKMTLSNGDKTCEGNVQIDGNDLVITMSPTADFGLTISAGQSVVYGFSFVILGDTGDINHSGPMTDSTFTMKFRATAE